MIKRQQGFTIVELVIAMAIFSFMSVILAAGIVRLFQVYQAGTAIRVSEQSASAVAQKITRDAQAAQAVAIGAPPSGVVGSPNAANFATICVFDLGTPTASNQPMTGSVYFVHDNTGGAYKINGDQIGLYELSGVATNAAIAVGSAAPTQSAINNACTAVLPTSITGADEISSTDTSAIAFGGNVINSGGSVPLLSAKLSMAATTDLTDIDAGNSGLGTGLCMNGNTDRYCSVTNLTITSGTRGGGQ